MLNLSRLLTVLGISLGLMACQSSQHSVSVESNINQIPDALAYTGVAHPLGLGKKPDPRTAGYAYLLLGDLPETDKARAQTVCQALFNDVESDKPTVALSPKHLVTYLPVTKTGDFRRVSSRFKWGMCKQLANLADSEREQAILSELDYHSNQGPLLVIYNQPYRVVQGEQQAIVVDLSKVPVTEIPQVVHNWKHNVAPDYALWKQGADLFHLHARLNEGLSNIRIAISTQPESFEFNTALSQQSAFQVEQGSPL